MEKVQKLSITEEETEPICCAVRRSDIQALAIKEEDLEKLHALHPPHDPGSIPVTTKYLVRKSQPKETKKVSHVLVACSASPRTPREPLTFSGRVKLHIFSLGSRPFGDGCAKILPHHILGSPQEFKMEALARGNTQLADLIEVPHQYVTAPALKEERGGEKKKKVHKTPSAQQKALQNWHCNMTVRKKQEKHLGEILQRPEDELLMNYSEDYRQIQEEHDLIYRSLPTLLPGKDLDGLEVIGKGQPFRSVTAEPFPRSTTSEESETLSDSLGKDVVPVVPEEVQGPSLVFCGQPARWINDATSCRGEIGIAARITFETLAGEKAKSSLTVSNNGTTAIYYNWVRLPHQIPSRETKGLRMLVFYFDTRPGVILPRETREFSFLFKSEKAGIFSESWAFRTHPELLGGALLQVTLWAVAVYEDKWVDLREKLESDLAAREKATIVEECVKELLVRIRTPERTPSPVDAYVTEEELFHRKNPELHYQHRVVQQVHELWRQHIAVPSAFEDEVPSGRKSTAEDVQYRGSASEAPPSQSSTTEVFSWKNTLEESPSQMMNVKKEEPGPSGWNLSFEDFKQAIKSIPNKEQQEAALSQLNKAVLELRVKQRPTPTNLLYQIGLQLLRETIDCMVSCSMRLRSQLGLPENTTYVDDVPEETGKYMVVLAQQPVSEGRKNSSKEGRRSIVGKDKEGKKRTKTAGKEQEERQSSRKLKEERKRRSSTSSQEGKEGAKPVEEVTTERAEHLREQVDPILFRKYQENLYVEVYGLLGSMVSKMAALFADLKKQDALK
ncbi:PREDICTED: MYCBP-associated protein [Mesitornis unicolor]|uniref:MYCBP-associated protein n=1 Tax=Mesitornis unicolor TaxID=54374 RepID=UPI0005281448|nr:PREDICTED: MYCBP-associated protein [Mesitornis unicolor]